MGCINRRDFLRMTAAAGAAVATLHLGPADAHAAPADSKKPNIIFIVADDLGYADMGCYGSKSIQTPHIDRLAADGIRFTDFYSGSTVCAPARCVLMTGYHTGHATVRNNGGFPIPDSEVTVAEVLKAAGYACGGFGKWGLGDVGTTGVPEKQGFDVFFGYYNQYHAHRYYTSFLWRNSTKVPLEGNGAAEGKAYSHYAIIGETRKFIRENKDKPFFCYCPWTPPHGEHVIPADDPAVALYKDKPWPAGEKTLAAMVSMLDRHVGEVRALVKELGLEDRTIILFTSDNGPAGTHEGTLDSAGAFRGAKGNLYEGGIRAPLIAVWPGRIRPGQATSLPSYFADVLPTLADLGGAETPKGLDGISIVPTLLGETGGRKQVAREYLYWEIGRASKTGQENYKQAARMGNWKAVRPEVGTPLELYDLAADVGEKNNVALKHPDIAGRMDEILKTARVAWKPPATPGPPQQYKGIEWEGPAATKSKPGRDAKLKKADPSSKGKPEKGAAL